jgi:hypothetical protein
MHWKERQVEVHWVLDSKELMPLVLHREAGSLQESKKAEW